MGETKAVPVATNCRSSMRHDQGWPAKDDAAAEAPTLQPAAFGQAAHMGSQQHARAQRLGQHQNLPRLQAHLAQCLLRLHRAVDGKACMQPQACLPKF